jgi:hypothetical protein
LRIKELRHLETENTKLRDHHGSYRKVNESHSAAMEAELGQANDALAEMARDLLSRNTECMELREKKEDWARESFEFQRFREHHTNELRCVRQELGMAELEIIRIAALERVTRHSFMKANTLMDRSRNLLKRWCSHDPASHDQLISKSAELIDDLSTDTL